VKKLIEYGTDDHPEGDPDKVPMTWIVAVMDDCGECDDLRIELTVEEAGAHGTGLIAHLSPDSTRRLRAVLANALREIGEDPGA